jgi:hypothetical protein
MTTASPPQQTTTSLTVSLGPDGSAGPFANRGEHNRVVAGGALVAALSGHPCEEEPGGRISFVWTDHVAIASGLSLKVALRHSHVKRPRGAAIRAVARGARIDYGDGDV